MSTAKTMGSTPTIVSHWEVYDHEGNLLHQCVELNEAIRERREQGGTRIERVDVDVSPWTGR